MSGRATPAEEPGTAHKGRFPALRLVSFSVLLCLVPLGVLTYSTIHVANQAVVEEVTSRVQTTTALSAALIQQQVGAVADLTASYATRPLLVGALADGNPANFQNDAIEQHLAQLATARPGIGGVFVTDTTCRLTQVVPSTPAIVGVDFSYRDWCKGVNATDRAYVSEAYRTAAVGQPLVVAAAVVIRGTGETDAGTPLGILGVLYTLDALSAFADQVASVQGIRLSVTDQRGTLLVGGPGSPEADATGLVSALADTRVSEALSGRSGVMRSTTELGDTLSAFAPVRTVGWTVTAEVPAREALAAVGRVRSTVFGVALILGLMLLTGVVLLARALRLRREAERTVVERETHTRSILAAATDAFISMDAAGVITAWNDQAREVFGWTEAEVLGRQLSETIVPPADRHHHERGLARFLATGEGPVLNRRIEVTALHRDGRRFPVELAIWPVRLKDTWSFNAFVHDITERTQARADLALARDQALEASQLKSEFLANMSHEIRTPMNGVLGMTSLLLATDLDVDQREFAETVLASGEGLLSILNDILDFSKIEAGRLDLESVDFDLRGMVEDVANLLNLPAHHKGLELVCSLPVDMPESVRGDAGRIRQVITNLVGNAVKFTPAGEVLLELTIAGDDEASPTVRFQVTDTGIGIADTHQAAVFDSFTQADAGTTRRYGGTGLGLAISRQLVELMGGQIGVVSELGRGSTFWFTIPLERGRPVGTVAPRASLTGLHILVVDDNRTTRAILDRFLQSWGVRSESADGAAAALRAIAASSANGHPFDAVLLDLNMPDMDGIELGCMILANPEIPPLQLVLLTSSGGSQDGDRARAAGITGHLTKPVRQSSLYDCLATILDAPPPDASPEVDGAGSRPRTARAGTAGHILLAEDNLVNQRVASAMLENLGFRVDIVSDGEEAVKASTLIPYDAILMDCQMPRLDGYQAATEIRLRQQGTRRVPIIAVTASAMKSDEERCLAAGMDDYLSKPIRLKALGAVLASWTPDPDRPDTGRQEVVIAAGPANRRDG